MIKNTCKTVDCIHAALKDVYTMWNHDSDKLRDSMQSFWGLVEEASLAVFGLACMRAQRGVSPKRWGRFFTALWDAREGRD